MSVVSNPLAAAIGSSQSIPAAHAAAISRRLPLVDALRALAASMIAWHHLTMYPPLATGAAPLAGGVLLWIHDHARAAQVFFVVSGYILAVSLSHRTWTFRSTGRYIAHRYCRLGVPYLVTIAMAIVMCAFGRGWIEDSVVGAPPTLPQLAAHVLFLQDILGYDSLSAGLWFVCINFQLALLYIAGLFLRDALGGVAEPGTRRMASYLPGVLGWLLAAASLFYFNLDESWDVWTVYFFGHFFLGILVHSAIKESRMQIPLVLYALLVLAAVAFEWRIRLFNTLLTGAVLFIGGKIGLTTRWPRSGVIEYLGQTSYSLFLIHFPIMIFVATLWTRWGWTSPAACLAGLFAAYFASVAASAPFYRFIESPAARLSRRFS